MPFIGIVGEENTENCIRREILESLKLRDSSVLFIKEKSIENIKNIKFETVILARQFKNIEMLKKILQNVTYLVINSDIEANLKLIKNMKATVVTYGFNTKATVTASSVKEEDMMICIQRNFENKEKTLIEPQEIKMPIYENANCTMAIASILLLYGKII